MNRGQVSIELIILILLVIVGALIVEISIPKQLFQSLEGPKSLKNATFVGFSIHKPIINGNVTNNKGVEENITSNELFTIGYTNIIIKGSPSLYLLSSTSKNGTPVYDGDVIENNGNSIKFYYLAENTSKISIFVRGSSITRVSNIKYIKNISTLEVDGSGNIRIGVVVDGVNIGTIGKIIVHGGGSGGSDLYFHNCIIEKIGSIVLSGGGSGNQNLIINNCNITEFPENSTIKGNAKIVIYSSYINGEYVDYKEITR
ncbi:class III signal peptide-containing protein [Methanotorris formicicus]|uniref:Uncharacterized protein n=1 Tax=Methanotorris formicicus Mc-S-70 TaxID=647171 RepID=H1KYN6_9EURY|nr:class III signal peptide-containing protein [Methanotorris formicicus]EHP86940.1 protein of unknown function DUF361 [Methanotorris formicicus Mc-S-70]